MNLQDFYQDRFHSDPYALLDAAADELAELAQYAGISWSDCAADIRLASVRGNAEKFSGYAGRYPTPLEKKLKGRVEIYSRLERHDAIETPFVNFVAKGSDAGSWSGLSWLVSQWKRYSSSATVVPISADEQRKSQLQAQRRNDRIQRDIVNSRIANQNRHQALMSYLAFAKIFTQAPLETGTHPYSKLKAISADVFHATSVRRINDDMMAFPLSRLDNPRIVGWQRIFKNGAKFMTNAVEDGEFSGACLVIGSLRNARRVAVAEGFATAAAVFQAGNGRFDAVICAINAGNLLAVIEQIMNLYPAIEVHAALDNDVKTALRGKGNRGMIAGIEILKKFPSVKCYFPKFPTDDVTSSDFNDLLVRYGSDAVAQQLRSKENRLTIPSSMFERELQLLAVSDITNRKKFAQQLCRVVDMGMLNCPATLSPRELILLIIAELKKLNVETIFGQTVRARVMRRFQKKCETAQAFRSFSARITDPAQRPDFINYRFFNSAVVTDEIRQYVQDASQTGPVIIRAGMGSGKTTRIIKPLMRQAQRAVAIAHRVSLIGGLWDVLTSDSGRRQVNDILHYQDAGATDQAPYANKLTICINSIIKPCWKPLILGHDLLAFDEATQGIRAILSGRAMENPVAVYQRMIDALAQTRDTAVLVDADANDLLVDVCEQAMARRESLGLPAWTQIHVVELPVDVSYKNAHEQPLPRKIFYTGRDQLMNDIIDAASRGEKIMLATDSTAFAEQALTAIKTQCPAMKCLYVSQDTKPEMAVIEFTDAPDRLASSYDVLIYTPAISSGVSIETRHYDRHYGFFCGQIVPSDAVQMLRRDRTAVEYTVGLEQLPGRKEDNAQAIRRGVIQAMLETARLTDEWTDAQISDETLSLGIADTAYTNLKIRAMAMEAKARNDFSNNLICILHADGYEVSHLATDAEAEASGSQIRKNAKQLVWDATVIRHIEAVTPTDEERDELLSRRSLSAEEQAQLTRWDIERELHLPVHEDSLKFIQAGARRKLMLHELMTMDEIAAARIDKTEAQFAYTYGFKRGDSMEFVSIHAVNRDDADEQFSRLQPSVDIQSVICQSQPVCEAASRTFASLHRRALRQYLQTAGIDPDTGAGEATPDGMAAAMAELITEKNIDSFNSILRFGGYVSRRGQQKRPETIFAAVCASLGLNPSKRRGGRSEGLKYIWSIESSSWSFMRDILSQRTAAGQSWFAHRETAQKIQPAQAAPALQRDPDWKSIYIYNGQSGSHQNQSASDQTAIDIVQSAAASLPVSESSEWLWSSLSLDDITELASLPLRFLRATLAGIYLDERLGTLTQTVRTQLHDLRMCMSA